AGETLVYDEVAGRAEWTGNVTLTAGTLVLTTESLVLTFIPGGPGEEPVLDTLTAGPEVDLGLEHGLVDLHSEGLTWAFATEQGVARNTTIQVTVPRELLYDIEDVPLRTTDLELTVHSPEVLIEGQDLIIQEPAIAVASERGRALSLTAQTVELRNPSPDTSRLYITRPRLTFNDRRLVTVPWRMQFSLRGPVEEGGLNIDVPRRITAQEGTGLATELAYGFPREDAANSPLWTLGYRPEWVIGDHYYHDAYLEYAGAPAGRVRLYYGTHRGLSAIDETSVTVLRAPELVWEGDALEFWDGVGIVPTLGYGRIEEPAFDRGATRGRAELALGVAPIPLGSEDLTLLLNAGLNIHFYEDFPGSYRRAYGKVAVRYVQEDRYGAEAFYYRRDDTGFSPFMHDRLQPREAVALRQRLLGPTGWGGALRLRYDLERDRWHEVDVGISRSFEVLQVTLFYQAVENGFALEFGVPGQI
ncbi:MAG TPA: hypothetical protein VEI97_17400, partial [bacterium]|nr:hypothetical protein [bacterium]